MSVARPRHSRSHCQNGHRQNHRYQQLSLALTLPGLIPNANGRVIINSPWTGSSFFQSPLWHAFRESRIQNCEMVHPLSSTAWPPAPRRNYWNRRRDDLRNPGKICALTPLAGLFPIATCRRDALPPAGRDNHNMEPCRVISSPQYESGAASDEVHGL